MGQPGNSGDSFASGGIEEHSSVIEREAGGSSGLRGKKKKTKPRDNSISSIFTNNRSVWMCGLLSLDAEKREMSSEF